MTTCKCLQCDVQQRKNAPAATLTPTRTPLFYLRLITLLLNTTDDMLDFKLIKAKNAH